MSCCMGAAAATVSAGGDSLTEHATSLLQLDWPALKPEPVQVGPQCILDGQQLLGHH